MGLLIASVKWAELKWVCQGSYARTTEENGWLCVLLDSLEMGNTVWTWRWVVFRRIWMCVFEGNIRLKQTLFNVTSISLVLRPSGFSYILSTLAVQCIGNAAKSFRSLVTLLHMFSHKPKAFSEAKMLPNTNGNCKENSSQKLTNEHKIIWAQLYNIFHQAAFAQSYAMCFQRSQWSEGRIVTGWHRWNQTVLPIHNDVVLWFI